MVIVVDERYKNALIYTIKTKDGLYVGSTINLTDRKHVHQQRIKNNKSNNKLYTNIRANNNEYKMEIYKHFPCNNKRELDKEESEIIKLLKCNLNEVTPFITKEEQRLNKKLYDAELRNSDGYKEYKKKIDKEYRDKNHEILKQKSIEYRNANREKIRQSQRDNYENRKHIVKAYHSSIVNCPCGCSVKRCSIANHRKTKKHLKLMKDKEAINN